MWEIQVAVLTMFAAVCTMRTSVPHVGKCNTTNIVSIHLPSPVVKELEKHVNWRVVFTTDYDSMEDHESYVISILGGRNYKAIHKKVMKDKSRSKLNSEAKYIDNVLVEEFVDNGKRHRLYFHMLELTDSLAELLYICSDVGDADVYYRAIFVPEEKVPSELEYQQLLACDKRIFGENHGTLTRLPDEIVDDDDDDDV